MPACHWHMFRQSLRSDKQAFVKDSDEIEQARACDESEKEFECRYGCQ